MWLGTSTEIGEGAALRSPTEKFAEPFRSAEPLTVRVRGVNVAEDSDPFFRGDNDTIVVTKTQFNDEPPVQRLHYLDGGVEPGWQDDFFTDIALGVRDLADPQNNPESRCTTWTESTSR